jgi:protein TonB
MADRAKSKPAEPEDANESLGSLALASAIMTEDKKPLKVAWISALVIHFALFLAVFPEFGGAAVEEEARQAVVIKRYKPPEPPKQQPEKKVVKKKTARVPIPDPTPDDPEPIVEENVEYVETEMETADTEFMVGGPVGGPPVIDQGPMRVGGEIQAPERIVYVPPNYPELARRARLAGVVILEATIDRDGAVTNVNVLRGLGLGLDEAAVNAVSQWMYTPTFYNGRPVEVLLTVTVQFQLQ